jgi:flagellar hook-basal body complex protein FliE
MTAPPIEAISALTTPQVQPSSVPAQYGAARAGGFEQILLGGINKVDGELQAAFAQARAATLDDSIPPHRVMFDLAEAQHSFELMLQIRNRLVEGYQDIMRMQL